VLSVVGVLNNEFTELFEFDDSVSVAIELFEQGRKVFVFDADLEFDKHELKLIAAQDAVAIQIE